MDIMDEGQEDRLLSNFFKKHKSVLLNPTIKNTKKYVSGIFYGIHRKLLLRNVLAGLNLMYQVFQIQTIQWIEVIKNLKDYW